MKEEIIVNYKLMENGKAPAFIREGDVCMDCYSTEDVRINKGTRKLVKLGFALQLPKGFEAVIRPRSGNSKKGIDVCIGTIDTNYRGELMANVVNNSEEPFTVNFGDRICQLAIREVPEVKLMQVEELDDTVRGSAGFGSSGI